MLTLKIQTDLVASTGYNPRSGLTYFQVGSKRYDRLVVVYQGQRRVWIRQDGTIHVRRSQPRRGQRHIYTRAMQYIMFAPKIGQFLSTVTAQDRAFVARLRRGHTYGLIASLPGQATAVELHRIRRRPYAVPTLNTVDLDNMRRSRAGTDAILHLEREYQETIKGHPRLSKLYKEMEPISA